MSLILKTKQDINTKPHIRFRQNVESSRTQLGEEHPYPLASPYRRRRTEQQPLAFLLLLRLHVPLSALIRSCHTDESTLSTPAGRPKSKKNTRRRESEYAFGYL
jgi:hypothetical protein